MSKKKTTSLTLKNGLEITIDYMPEEKYIELLDLKDAKSEEKILIGEMGYFSPKDIAKISRS